MKNLQKKIKETQDRIKKQPTKNLQVGNPNSNILVKNTVEIRKVK